MAKSAPMLVRLKPFNPRKGYVMKTYVDGPTGAVFREERGWYEVDDPVLIERLKECKSRPDREESPNAFDVCTREQAIELERRIRREQQLRHSSLDPLSVEGASRDHIGGRAPRFPPARDRSTLTTADLPGNQSPLRTPLDDEPADASDLDSDDLAASVDTEIGRKAAPTGSAASPKKTSSKKTAAAKKPSTPPPAGIPGAPTAGILPSDGTEDE